ncbi:MAG TPA: hypothetical protein P5069_01430 [Candidatus Hydrogenedentes bacterium]|nr:hypothetical protein [Candidatus Hydrogenedentota bacterium]
MTPTEVLGSEPVLTLALSLLGAAWTFFRSGEWIQQRRRARLTRALRTLEAAILEVYEEYVRGLKEGAADGHLTIEERRHARRLARDRAVALARAQGVDLIRDLGGDSLDLWIARLIRRMKTGK